MRKNQNKNVLILMVAVGIAAILGVGVVSLSSLQPIGRTISFDGGNSTPSPSEIIQMTLIYVIDDNVAEKYIDSLSGSTMGTTMSSLPFGVSGWIKLHTLTYSFPEGEHKISVGWRSVSKDAADISVKRSLLIKLDDKYIAKGEVSSGEFVASRIRLSPDQSWSFISHSIVDTAGIERVSSSTELGIMPSPTETPSTSIPSVGTVEAENVFVKFAVPIIAIIITVGMITVLLARKKKILIR